jgi:transposase
MRISYVGVVDKEVRDMAYPKEFRRAVAAAYEACGSSAQVAKQFHCSESWVRRLIQRRRELGTLDPLPAKRPDNNKLRPDDLDQLARLIADQPDMTLGELADALTKKVSVPTVHRATKKLKLPFKKSPSSPASKTGRTSSKDGTRGSKRSAT